MFRYRSGTSLDGVCAPASGSYASAWKIDVTSYRDCRTACEAEILPLNTDYVYRGLSLHTVDDVPRCSCQFDNPTGASVNVPASGWVASDSTGSGPVVKHNGEVGAKCFPVVDCVEKATNLPNLYDPDICYDYCLPYMDSPGFAGYQYSNGKGICECHFDNGQLPPRGSLPPGSSVNDQGGGSGPVIGRHFESQCYDLESSASDPGAIVLSGENIEETNERFGAGLSVDQDYLVVGAWHHDNGKGINTNSGGAYVYKRTLSGWSEVAKLSAVGREDNSDNLG